MSLVSAVATDLRTVRVGLSLASDATALVASNWGFAGTSDPPFVIPVVASVDDVNDDGLLFDLSLGFELTPSASYTVTSTGVTNGGTHAFSAPALPAVSGRSFRIIDWIPEKNIREDDTGDLRKFVSALDEGLQILLYDVDRFPDIQDPDVAPEMFVDQMLADFGNPVTEASLTSVKKRHLVKTLIPLYQEIGTAKGLKDAVWFFLGLPSEITIVNRQGMRLGTSLLEVDWVLGCGPDKWRLLLKVGTPSGRAFTVLEARVLAQIVNVMKYAQDRVATQAALPAPTGVAATASGTPVGVTVSWSAVTGAVSYAVYMTSVTGTTTRNGSRWAASGTSLNLPMLAGKHRYFIVTAINARGEGFSSAQVDAISG
jgi:phage tail-like protein